ncbi:MAG TPA: hypothetical protein VGP43_02485 [Chitinophagaceae bacterium]|nr:hypothetical protein [Chitinophagaceae bacterium]
MKRDLIDKLSELEVVQYQSSVHSATQTQSKILDINAKANQKKKQLADAFYKDQLKIDLQNIENASKGSSLKQEAIINNPHSGDDTKRLAARKKLTDELSSIEQQQARIQIDVDAKFGSVEELKAQIKSLEIKAAEVKNKISLQTQDDNVAHLTNIISKISAFQNVLSQLSSSSKDLNKDISDVVVTLSKLAAGVTIAVTSYKNLISEQGKLKDAKESGNKKDQLSAISGVVGAAIGVVGAVAGIVIGIVKYFKAAKESRIKAEAELKSYLNSLIVGEIEYNELLRKRALSQQDINKLTLTELEIRRKLIDTQKQQAQADYDSLLAQIQATGQQVTGEHTKKYGGILGLGRKTKIVQDLASIGNAGFDQLEKLFTEGKLDAATAKWFEQLRKVHDEMDGIKGASEDLERAINERVTGTTSTSITDSIADGFSQGFKSVQDFAGKTEDLIRGAMLNALKYQALEGPVKKLFEQFAKDAESGGGLDTSEIAKFNLDFNKIISDASKFAEQMQKATGINLSSLNNSNQNSLKGAIQTQLSENTGSVLAGQFGGLRLTAIEQLNVARTQLQALNKIEANTAAAVVIMGNYYRKWDTTGIKIV